ncbi:hypothetical protein IJG78_03870 [Candidatus Saccharibacteria bacterium]|nr:hypothetical protein [Candidatus Saccharibacteria bacterium]
MRVQKKQLLGLGGLAFVVGMTAVAYNLPTSALSAEGNVDVHVQVYSNHFETVIEAPLDGADFNNSNVDFREIHSNANKVHYYLTHVGENGEADVTYELTDYNIDLPAGEQTSGYTEFQLNLDNYGSYGTYIFRSVVTASDGRTKEDSVKFTYSSIIVPEQDIDVDPETGEVEVEVCYAAGTKVITLEIKDKNGNVVSQVYDYVVTNPETGGCETIKVKVDNIGLDTGDYDIVINTYDNPDKSGKPTGTIVVELSYTAPDAPNVPDTGSMLSALNISKSDFLITGLLGFTVISVIALFVIKRANRK